MNDIRRVIFALLCTCLGVGLSALAAQVTISGDDPSIHTRDDLVSTDEVLWRQNSIGQGGSCFFVRVHPEDPERVVESNDMGGTYVSTDGSKTFEPLTDTDTAYPRLSFITDWSFFAGDTNVGYAVTNQNGIFKTENGGLNWSPVSTESAEPGLFWTDQPYRRFMSAVAVDPENPDIVFVGLGTGYWDNMYGSEGGHNFPRYAGGLIHTSDGGKTWTSRSKGLLPKAIVRDIYITHPATPGKVIIFLATSHGFYVSRDRGETWTKKPAEARAVVNEISGKHKAEKTLPHDRCRDMAVWEDPDTGDTVIYVTLETRVESVGDRYDFIGGVWRSDDQGETWREANGNLHLPADLVLKTESADAMWHVIRKLTYQEFFSDPTKTAGLEPETYDENSSLYSAAYRRWTDYQAKRRKELYAEKDQILQKVRNNGTILQDFFTIEVHPTNPDILYVADAGDRGLTFPPHGVWKTEDGGKTWVNITRGADGWKNPEWEAYRSEGPVLNITQSYVKDNLMNKGGIRISPFGAWDVRTFDISRSDPNVLYFSSHRVVYKSTDAGRTWIDATNYPIGENGWMGVGNSNLTTTEVFFHPEKPGHMLLTQHDEGLWKSVDGGETFIKTEHFDTTNQAAYAAAFDPDDPETVYAAMHFSPGYDGTGGHFFLKSSDGAMSWNGVALDEKGSAQLTKEMVPFPPAGIVTAIVIDPDSPKDARRIYLCNPDPALPGVKISVDAGKSFETSAKGLGEKRAVNHLALDAADSSIIYAAVLRGEEDGGLYVSRDRGETWSRIESLPLKSALRIRSLPGVLYVAGGYGIQGGKDPDGGVYKSTDQGKSWQRIFSAPQVNDVAAPIWAPELVYCSVRNSLQVLATDPERRISANPGIYRSSDGGKTWTRANRGLAMLRVWSITFNPHIPGEVWCATSGTGFYKGLDRQFAGGAKGE
ncbi:hypothetical protein HQ520_08510 [bacterium]|nr:hypothetical protein [bacterium]